MRQDLPLYKKHQVFLNYPFDRDFLMMSYAMHFSVIAAGLIPVCAKDLSVPDRPRVDMLVKAVASCQYSAHDLSRGKGEGNSNYARLNMPLELGMAMFHAFNTDGNAHRYAFFVGSANEYKSYVSDLSGLDAQYHDNDDVSLLRLVYEWLRFVVPGQLRGQPAAADVVKKYNDFKVELTLIDGSDKDGDPSHAEGQELMFQICETEQWWQWRGNPLGLEEFPRLTLARKPPGRST
jgi:hypothetical protein